VRPGGAAKRLAAIDMAKGLAILWVLGIHSSRPGRSDPRFIYFVNHAVPVFLILFGLNAEQWWRARAPRVPLREWYLRSWRRILVPVWLVLPLWWVMVRGWRPPDVPMVWRLVAAHYAGYLAYVGTGWFVTVIIQLAVIFPALHLLGRRLGTPAVLLLGLGAFVAMLPWNFLIMTDYNVLVFAGRFLAIVAFGMLLAPYVARLGPGAALGGALGVAAGIAVARGALGPRWVPFAGLLHDPGLTVALLGLFAPLTSVPGAALLAWLGRHSWAMYLGQMLTHNAAVFWLGLNYLYGGPVNLWLYTLVLFAGGIAAVGAGALLERLAAALASRVPLGGLLVAGAGSRQST
jgi:peptidoglycan/LPS O-acetylase OafA/YrhL